MDKFIDGLIILIIGLLGGGIFWFLDKKKIKLPNPPTKEKLKEIKEKKENELRKTDPTTFINNHLDNAGAINDIKSASDKQFDDILDKHRKNLDG